MVDTGKESKFSRVIAELNPYSACRALALDVCSIFLLLHPLHVGFRCSVTALAFHLSFVDLLSPPGLDGLEFAQGCTAGEELVDLLQGTPTQFWDEEKHQDDHDDVDSAVDVPDLGTEVGILDVDKVRQGKGGDESGQNGDDTCEQVGLFLDARGSCF